MPLDFFSSSRFQRAQRPKLVVSKYHESPDATHRGIEAQEVNLDRIRRLTSGLEESQSPAGEACGRAGDKAAAEVGRVRGAESQLRRDDAA